MSSLAKRTFSALIAILIIFAVYYFAKETGLFYLGIPLVALVGYEYDRIALKTNSIPSSLRVLFYFSFIILTAMTLFPFTAYQNFIGVILTAFWAATLWISRGKINNETILKFLAFGTLGLVYCSILPSLCLKLLSLDRGISWFSTLLLLVFAGDVFAYFGGVWFGKKKLMPDVSPGKTIVGAFSGLIGSMTAGVIMWSQFFTDKPLHLFVLMIIAAAVLAQSGDLFISLLKRVANVKDSGKIMPGHGGALDRLDGLFFATPVIFMVAI